MQSTKLIRNLYWLHPLSPILAFPNTKHYQNISISFSGKLMIIIVGFFSISLIFINLFFILNCLILILLLSVLQSPERAYFDHPQFLVGLVFYAVFLSWYFVCLSFYFYLWLCQFVFNFLWHLSLLFASLVCHTVI